MLQSQLISNEEILFSCVLKNARILLSLLQSINLNESLVVIFSQKGIQFTSEKNKSFQITAYLQRELFSSFTVPEEAICFNLSNKILLDCLTSMLNCAANPESQEDKDQFQMNDDVNTSLEIMYNGYGHPLILVLKDEISTTECTLQTQDSENIISFEMLPENVLSKIIISSEFFKEILSELNLNSENIQISCDPQFGLVLVSSGQNVTTIKKIPKDCIKLINHDFKQLHTNSYMTKFIKLCMKALNLSTKVCIRIDENGLLNIEYMVSLENDIKCFIQTYCMPNLESTL